MMLYSKNNVRLLSVGITMALMLAILLWIWFSQSAELREETSKSITLKAEQTQKNNQENIQNNHREKTADELLLESMYGGYYFNTIN